MTPRPASTRAIHLQPLGEDVPLEFLDSLAAALARTFGLSCHVREWTPDISTAFDAGRGQYYSTAILQQLMPLAALEEGVRLLGVTQEDLFVPVLTFVFGEAQLGGDCAVVSLHRLRQEFYGLPPDENLLFERAVKEAVHELGHTFGLRHCRDWECVMASTHAVERLDLKRPEFCEGCRHAIEAGKDEG